MTILTIGQNPYLSLKHSKINRALLEYFSTKNTIESIILDYDNVQFLAKEDGYSYNNIKLHPYFGERGDFPKFFINVCKQVQPNVIITIGDYAEHFSIWQIKQKYNNLFKWICYLTNGFDKIHYKFAECLKHADLIITSTQIVKDNLSKVINNRIEYIPFGTSGFYSTNIEKQFGAIYLTKNYQTSNINAFINAINKAKIRGYLHTNVNNKGDSNFDDIMLPFHEGIIENYVELPKQFIANHEYITDEELNIKINEFPVVVDCSFYSETGLSLLDCMSTGCIPIGVDYGAIGEIINKLPEEYRFFIDYNVFYGSWGEKYAVINENDLVKKLLILEEKFKKDKGWWQKGENIIKNMTKEYSKEYFLENINNEVEEVICYEDRIIVDVYI